MQLIIYAKREFKSLTAQNSLQYINSVTYTRIAFLNSGAFDVILSSIQLSQHLKVSSNGGPLNKKIPVKTNRSLSEIKA